MVTRATTVRLPEGLADRLRRAHYLTKRANNQIIVDALEHWLANPRKPGCVPSHAVGAEADYHDAIAEGRAVS
jgi:predicted transcriptional regulator